MFFVRILWESGTGSTGICIVCFAYWRLMDSNIWHRQVRLTRNTKVGQKQTFGNQRPSIEIFYRWNFHSSAVCVCMHACVQKCARVFEYMCLKLCNVVVVVFWKWFNIGFLATEMCLLQRVKVADMYRNWIRGDWGGVGCGWKICDQASKTPHWGWYCLLFYLQFCKNAQDHKIAPILGNVHFSTVSISPPESPK